MKGKDLAILAAIVGGGLFLMNKSGGGGGGGGFGDLSNMLGAVGDSVKTAINNLTGKTGGTTDGQFYTQKNTQSGAIFQNINTPIGTDAGGQTVFAMLAPSQQLPNNTYGTGMMGYSYAPYSRPDQVIIISPSGNPYVQPPQ